MYVERNTIISGFLMNIKCKSRLVYLRACFVKRTTDVFEITISRQQVDLQIVFLFNACV